LALTSSFLRDKASSCSACAATPASPTGSAASAKPSLVATRGGSPSSCRQMATCGVGVRLRSASRVMARILSISSEPCRRVDSWLIRRRLSLRASSVRRDSASSASARLRSLWSRTVASRCGSPRISTTFNVTSASNGVPSYLQCSHSKTWVAPPKAAVIFSTAFSSERRPSAGIPGE
jgi:hypothetical protein